MLGFSCSDAGDGNDLGSTTFPQDFTLTFPPSEATEIHPGFEFQWTESPSAVSYELHMGETIIAETVIITGITTNSHTVDDLRYGKTYCWKVVGINAKGQRAESLPLCFETKTNWFVLDEAFPDPQLDTERTIWVYLPPTYESDMKDYPVLYMFDGIFIFDDDLTDELSDFFEGIFYATWKIDEHLDLIFQESGFSMIVVAIDTEFGRSFILTPWQTPDFRGGQGDEFMEFIVQNLKPFIDEKYRTLSDKTNTGIMGASLGGLMAGYAIFEYPEVFGKAGIFSPSFWYVDENMFELAEENLDLLDDHKLYFLVPSNDVEQIKIGLDRMIEFLDERGFTNYKTKIQPGYHNSLAWGAGFPEAIEWLFQSD